MIDEQIKKLLVSELENDQLLGWEIISAKKIPYTEVMEFIKEVNETSKEYQFYWNNDRFKLNRWTMPYRGVPGTAGQVLTVTGGQPAWIPNYNYPTYLHNIIEDDQIQEKKRMGKARKIWSDIKAFIKRF